MKSEATSNINDLQKNLRRMFDELFTSGLMEAYALEAGNAMKDNVQTLIGSKYSQSGRLKNAISTEKPAVQTEKSSIKIGFGNIENLNSKTLRQRQLAYFGGDKRIFLKAEKELPSWIIMEFGRKPYSGALEVPDEFKVNYTPRDSEKTYMFGPSMSYHYRKPVFFMTTREDSNLGMQHPGIMPGKFFRNGLENSKQAVYETMLKALAFSMGELARKYGGEVV